MSLFVCIFCILALSAYIIYLQFDIRKLRKSFKELLQESRRQTPTEKRNIQNIYFHLDDKFSIIYMNNTACSFFETTPDKILNQSALGTIFENTPANVAYLTACLNRLQKHPETINNEIIVTPNGNTKVLMKIRIRPILNEILNCIGMSIILSDIVETQKLQNKLLNLQERDILNNKILNENALFRKFEKEFNRCNRYNKNFSLVVLELKDIYDFICKGINFETGDKLIIQAGKLCYQNTNAKRIVGRFNKTKFAILLPNEPRETAANFAQNLYYPLLKTIQFFGVDRYNAEMFVISYTNRKNFNETPDTLLGRINRHISLALKARSYGIKSSDKES